MRIALVTPFSWSQPHDVNEHVAGVAAELRRIGHDVTVLAPSNRAKDLRAGRRALLRSESAEVIAVGPALPISRRSAMGVPVGVRANLAQALARGFDVVHGFEPGLPSISNLALRDATSLSVASFFSPDRLGYPPGKAQRQKLLARIDALVASSAEAAAAAAERFPGDYAVIGEGIDPALFRPAKKVQRIVCEWRTGERPVPRAVVRSLAELPGWELVLLRTKPLAGSPYVPRALQGRVHLRTARDGASRAALLRGASIFVPAPSGLRRLRLEAAAAGCAIADAAGVDDQPELAAAATLRLAGDAGLREQLAADGHAAAGAQSFAAVAAELDALYAQLATRRRPKSGRSADPLAGRDLILVDLHMHTSWSHDCQVDVEDLLDHAEAIGLGAIAVTDHNVFAGAAAAVELARHRDLVVIPGEEVKTDNQGEIIGLFLEEEIPRGMTFAETIAAIRAQNGIVYLPHPFDRMHAIPQSATIHRHLADIDVFEAYNARLLWEGFNDEAERFARKYGLTVGAGSDAHVLQGVGTGALRMRRFDGPEEFLLSLRSAEIVRRPRSLVYLQSLKWVAQMKERTVKEKAR
jgi:hypothetical protein